MRTLGASPLFLRSGLLTLTVVTAAACSGSAAPNDLGVTSEAQTAEKVTDHYGVDFSDYRPSLNGLKHDGYTFVARYLSYETTGEKNLTHAEADDIRRAGLSIVMDWEYAADAALNGYEQGVKDARNAKEQADAVGAPSAAPIYFSLDFDVTESQYDVVDRYFDGVASVLGRARTGAYGGYYPIRHLFDEKKIDFAWQTYAWSDGQWDSRAQLRQIENGIAGGNEDKDRSVANSFGQWGQGEYESLGEKIAKLALDNVDKQACSTNSLGHKDFDSSCTGNDGHPEYWCADFARWVWSHAGVGDVEGLTAAAGSFYTYGDHHGTRHSEPAVGDAVVFNYVGDGVAEHVAIVTKVESNGDIETVSGDWDGESGSEAHFASTSHVRLDAPAYSHDVGHEPRIMGMKISGFIAPH